MLLYQCVRLQYVLKNVLGRSGMKWLLLLFRKPSYVISIEKEGIVVGCPRIFICKPSKSGQVYSIAVHIFFVK